MIIIKKNGYFSLRRRTHYGQKLSILLTIFFVRHTVDGLLTFPLVNAVLESLPRFFFFTIFFDSLVFLLFFELLLIFKLFSCRNIMYLLLVHMSRGLYVGL